MPGAKRMQKRPVKRSGVLRQVPTPRSWDFSRKYQIIFEQASDAILTVLPDGVIDAFNSAAQDLTGYLAGEILGLSVGVLVPEANGHHLPEHSRPFSPELLGSAGTYEDVALRRKDGYVRLVDIRVRMVQGEDTQLAVVLLRDLTERKQMERENITKYTELRRANMELERKNAELRAMKDSLVQAGKLIALGELAAGTAHELNQPLQGIRGYAQELRDMSEAAGRTAAESAAIREIISSADKMARIIQNMRDLTRKSVENFESVDVHAVIDDALKLFNRQLQARGIRVDLAFAPAVPRVFANALQLEQVFINLIGNGRDAIEATGRGSGTIRISTEAEQGTVVIRFRDDGSGMAEKTRTRIFDPFFTTKEPGKGMGLGLSLSLGMISRINGTILVDSEIGKGTEFVIRLPEDFREVSAPGSDDSSDGEMTEITDGKVVSIGKNVQADAKRNR
jgi:PAS domain S-box-containing protein